MQRDSEVGSVRLRRSALHAFATHDIDVGVVPETRTKSELSTAGWRPEKAGYCIKQLNRDDVEI